MKLYNALYKHWYGYNPDYPIHHLAYRGWIGSFVDYIPKIKSGEINVNGYNEYGSTPLTRALEKHYIDPYIAEKYEIAIMLLELGSSPHLPAKSTGTPITNHIDERNLEVVRLLLWYDPEYEFVPDKQGVTAIKKLDKVDAEFKRIVIDTAKDARQVKILLEQGKKLADNHNFIEAVAKYKEAALIFQKNGKMEESVKYNAEQEEFRPIFLNFYKQKVLECYKLCEGAYQQILPTRNIKTEHLAVVKELAELCTKLKLGNEAIRYAKRTAELIHDLETTTATQPVQPIPNLSLKRKEQKDTKEKVESETTPLLSREDNKKSEDSKRFTPCFEYLQNATTHSVSSEAAQLNVASPTLKKGVAHASLLAWRGDLN